MNFPIEIDGKTYDFAINRNAIKNLNFKEIDSNDISANVELMENMFYQFLIVKNPNFTREEGMALLDKALEEYGYDELSKALGQIASTGFTMKGNSKISWLKK